MNNYYKNFKANSFKHKREPNPNAEWGFQAAFMFTDETVFYPEEDVPRQIGKINFNGKKDTIVIDCTPDCRQIYWYLKSHPKNVYWTLRDPYDLCMFKYAQNNLCDYEYVMIHQMMKQLDITDYVHLIHILSSYVDYGIRKINYHLDCNRMAK